MARRVLKFWSLSRREKRFFCEAGLLSLLSYLCVRAIAFRHIDRLLRAHWKDCARSACDRADDIKLVNLSLSRAANLLSWKSRCLSRSIAEFIMLRRRGIPAVIMAGVRFSDSSLDAHAWVDTGLGVNDKASENSDFTTVIRVGTGAVDR